MSEKYAQETVLSHNSLSMNINIMDEELLEETLKKHFSSLSEEDCADAAAIALMQIKCGDEYTVEEKLIIYKYRAASENDIAAANEEKAENEFF